jgi:hypothetical protein
MKLTCRVRGAYTLGLATSLLIYLAYRLSTVLAVWCSGGLGQEMRCRSNMLGAMLIVEFIVLVVIGCLILKTWISERVLKKGNKKPK